MVQLVHAAIDAGKVLKQDLDRNKFKLMTHSQMDRLRFRMASVAADGRFELFKTTARHHAADGRAQHGCPPQDELGGMRPRA